MNKKTSISLITLSLCLYLNGAELIKGDKMEMITSVSQAFKHGGIWMWVIFIAQMFSIAIIAERVFALYINRKIDSRKFIKLVEEDIRRGNLDRAIIKAKNMGDIIFRLKEGRISHEYQERRLDRNKSDSPGRASLPRAHAEPSPTAGDDF